MFKLETKYGDTYPGGSNTEKLKFIKTRHFFMHFKWKYLTKEFSSASRSQKPINVPDFISEKLVLFKIKNFKNIKITNFFSKTFLDTLKQVFFMYFYWITLSIIFVCGTSKVTIFSVGYIFGCFVLLWIGNSLFFKPILVAIRMFV